MAKPPASPSRAAEALDWFQVRLELTARRLREAKARAERSGKRTAKLTQLRVANEVMLGIDDAIREGSTLADFKELLRQRILGSTMPSDPALETSFRTNVQTSYMAGRMRQVLEPETLALRPYLKFDAILDGRTSEICRDCNGKVLPASHPWWLTHTPPLHFRCRSGIRNLTPEVARAEGITAHAPQAQPKKGFGNPLVFDQWTPDLANVHPALVKAYKRKT